MNDIIIRFILVILKFRIVLEIFQASSFKIIKVHLSISIPCQRIRINIRFLCRLLLNYALLNHMLINLIGVSDVYGTSIRIVSWIGVWGFITLLVSNDCSSGATTVASHHLTLAFVLPINELRKVLLNSHIWRVYLIFIFNTGGLGLICNNKG